MRAAVLSAPGAISVVSDWPEPVCRPDDVVVTMIAVGICGTDLGYWSGYRVAPEYPWILGHEGFGVITAGGEAVDRSRIGERVAIEPNFPCGRCEPCRNDAPSLCRDRGSVALTSPGVLAERVAVPGHFAWTIPHTVSDRDALCIEPLAVALAAVRRASLTPADSRVLVVGAGALGLLLVDALIAQGRSVFILEPQVTRREFAIRLGAQTAADPDLFPVSFETSGHPSGGSEAIQRLLPGGRAVFVGVGNDPVPLDTRKLVRDGLTLIGSMIYDHPGDFAATISAVHEGRISPGGVLGPKFPLAEAESAFAQAGAGVGKTWIWLREESL